MERLCIALIMINLSSSQVRDTSTEATVSRLVQLGDSVTLHCDVNHDTETIWHGQHCGKVPFIIIAAVSKIQSEGKTETKYFRGFDLRFSVNLNAGNKSVYLKIANVTKSDLGLYYCVTNPGVPMLTGGATMLVLAENGNISATSSNSSREFTGSTEPEQRVVEHHWVLLVILCPVCVMVGALLHCACLHRKHHQNGLKPCERRKTSMETNTEKEEEEDCVIYAAVKLHSGPPPQTRQTLDSE